MRILIVSAFYESHGGGIEVVAGELARALARRGHDCSWAAADFDPAPEGARVRAVPFPASDPLERWTGLPMPLPTRAARRLLDQQVQVAEAIIIHDALYASSLLAARYANRHGKPWIIVQHIGSIPFNSPLLRMTIAAANRLVTRPLLRHAPQSVFISDEVRRFFGGSAFARQAALLFNGVDHRCFREPRPKERTRLRAALGMRDGRRQLLFVGRFVEKKGLPVIREMAHAQPQWDFHLAGTGPIDPRQWGLPNVLIGGRRTREQLADLYRAADALVLPSVGEGFPLVVQEAMASGLPVFCGLDSAMADPGARDLLNGIAVVPEDAEGTAARFIAAITKTDAGPDARLADYARSTYDWDANARWIDKQLRALGTKNHTRTVGFTGGGQVTELREGRRAVPDRPA